ncbi:hypothetical protein MPTK1_6g20250 [Marchantia polymorpha subsp. ruderalis]|uniref:Uncharacterized protein n=2 Tax=Marchantia polymorpha TaxID=3197 RepID=A0AAF6BU40_MARPO|nr:hypothetical protein MARPO_0045s0039 [Marchantia polymorpha]BBN15524.1 hypothetical protein Mp_6g20250 [Marchantia polymorpha subsp. ruderalis]|eukprot:PTQ39365.1 hypothetical protein MARPO_0045s0039 [Marchantia polymorpha]
MLHQVCMHLMPLKVAGRLLEQDATRLDTVVRTLARLSKNFQNILEVDASHALESILEKRWLKMLQPIMVLAYVLHPMLQLNHINRMEPIGQPHNLCQLASNLYTEYFGGTIEYRDAVIRQFGEYKTHKDNFSLVNAYACEKDPTSFWVHDAEREASAGCRCTSAFWDVCACGLN